MKIINLNHSLTVYTSNVYLILGTWNTLRDINTLVDVGRDPAIVDLLEQTHTGVGKRKVDRVVLTHAHYDHTSNIPVVKAKYSPEVYAFSKYINDVDKLIIDGAAMTFGDREFRSIHTPGHTGDSVCFFCKTEGVLFSGDTAIKMNVDDTGRTIIVAGEIEIEGVKVIYPGHGGEMVVG